MTWQLLLLISIVSYSISGVLQRAILREENGRPIAYSILFQFLAGILIAVVGFLLSDMTLPDDIRPLALNMLFAILLYGFGNVFIFKALKTLEASRFTVIFATRAMFTVLASSIFLHEFLTLKGFIGALLIFLGLIVVNDMFLNFKLTKGLAYSFLAAVFFGVANTNDRFILQSFNLYPYLVFAFIAPALFMSFIFKSELKYMHEFLKPSYAKKVIVLCLFYSLSAATFFAALSTGDNSSQIASINLTSVILIVLLSIVFLKERSGLKRKLLAASLSFVGLLLLA